LQLPRIILPEFETILPLSKKKVVFRPFTAGAEKVFLIALQSNEVPDFIRAIHQIISLCLVNKIDIKNLPLRDLEYLFIQIRCKSISDVVEISFKCPKPNPENEDGLCGYVIKYKIDLEKDLKIEIPPDKHNIIRLQENPLIGIEMRYPRFEVADKIAQMKTDGNIQSTFEIIKDCVSTIFEEEKIYTRDKFTDEELTQFLEGLSQPAFGKIRTFFDTIPDYKFEAPFHCTKCGHKSKIKLQGIADFFG